jgi:streptogrisin C
VATTLVALPARAEPTIPAEPESSSSPTDPHAQVRQSLDYLMTTYGIEENEALRRLELQDRSVGMVDRVRSAIGVELLDVWLDQDGGGRLTFLTSKPADVADELRGVVTNSEEVRVLPSKYTSGQLRAAEVEVRERLAAETSAEVGIDFRNERVVVRYVNPSGDQRARIRELAGATARGGVPVQVDAFSRIEPGRQKDCNIFACDTPMRGGLRLHIRKDDGSWGSCTSGFNIRANGPGGAAFVLTAGHCAINPGPKRQFAYHNGLPVAVEVNASGSFTDPAAPADGRYWENAYPRYDYALMPFQVTGATLWHMYWFTPMPQHNLVFSDCRTPTANPCSQGNVAIVGLYTWSQIMTGWVVCGTGTGNYDVYPDNGSAYSPGTRCGTIQNKRMCQGTYNDPPCSSDPHRGIKVNICSRDGDSGGPLWVQSSRLAIGILSGGPDRTGACSLSDPLDYSVYSPLHEILTHASGQTGSTMLLITTSNG